MGATDTLQSSTRSSTEKAPIEHIESASIWQQERAHEKYALLKDKTPEELKALNKKVVKKLDWRFLLCITAMLLMKYVSTSIFRWPEFGR